MAFDLQQWKEQVRERLRDFAANPKEALKRAGAETLFGYLVGMTVFPLAQAREAMAKMESARQFGKIALTVVP